MRIETLIRPKSIAIIGASEKPTIGRRLIASLERIGFAGAIFPFNPNYTSVLGRPCYPSLADTPEVPELAGCAADGLTRQEALANAEIVIGEWIETAQEMGRPIPEPKGRLLFA